MADGVSDQFEEENLSGASEPQPFSAAVWSHLTNWPSRSNSYWLTRFVILRCLGFVYFIAFLAAANQLVPLIGKRGLLPAESFLQRVASHFGSRLDGFFALPSIFWFDTSDAFLVATAWAGLVLSFLVMAGFSNAILMTTLWALYMSIIHVGQDWYSYGWEIQLLETGFLAIFLCPLFGLSPFPRQPPATPVIWLFRWLGFRIMLGAGLIKMRGDPCWRDCTCLYYHYETQPIPNPLSLYLHFMPHWFHRFGVGWNHFIELVVPWFAFWPRISRHIAGVLMVSFQGILILSGNLSFLNWLTIIPMLACFDDTFWRRILPRWLVQRVTHADAERPPSKRHRIAVGALVVVVAWLSLAPIANLLSPHQAMNTSFNRLHLVNTYGAFGSVGKERYEIIFEGTTDTNLTERTAWKEYEFKAKPGDIRRRPPVVAPYQPRIDWQIWFAAMSTPDNYPWTLHFIWKLLHNDSGTLSLLANNPFPDAPPKFIRADLYQYEFAPRSDPSGAWWKRTRLRTWLPAMSVEDSRLRRFLEAYGWLPSNGPQ